MRINIIITRNIRDNKDAVLPVMTPETFLKINKQTAMSQSKIRPLSFSFF